MNGNKALWGKTRELGVLIAVGLISAVTLLAVLVVLGSSAWGAYHLYQSMKGDFVADNARHFSIYAAEGLGVTIATTGLSATVICLLLRLRNHDNDMVTPPALTGPIVVVALGAALALGALIFVRV